MTSYGRQWLGDDGFDPVFAELNRRGAAVYSHPVDAPCCHNLLPRTGPQVVEYNTDTSRAIWNLINDGTDPATGLPITAGDVDSATLSKAARFGNINFIWSHAGGSLLGLVGRFLGRGARAESLGRTPPSNSRLHHLRRFYYDTAGSTNPIQMQGLKALVGISQIVLGSDFPFGPITNTVEGLQNAGLTRIIREEADSADTQKPPHGTKPLPHELFPTTEAFDCASKRYHSVSSSLTCSADPSSRRSIRRTRARMAARSCSRPRTRATA